MAKGKADEQQLFLALDRLEVFKLEGRDKRGRRILRVVGKLFPARTLGEETLRRYLEERIFRRLVGEDGKCERFCVVYAHSLVSRRDNFPGVAFFRSVYESLPAAVRQGLEVVYFVHPGLQSRLFLATVGRFLFSAGLYGKVRYMSRLVYLWENIRKGEVEMPEFVVDHDEDLENRPLMDYWIETDHHRVHDASAMDSAASMYFLRCIS